MSNRTGNERFSELLAQLKKVRQQAAKKNADARKEVERQRKEVEK